MESANFSRYRNSEFLQYIKDVLELVNAQDVDVLQLTIPRDSLQTITNQMDDLFQEEQSSGITQELIDLDTRRDRAITGIKGLLETHQNHYDDAMQAAARSLLYNMNTFGTNIPRMNYQAETAVIDSMLADWNSEPELVAAIATLQINDWVAELTTSNGAFSNRFLARISESAANPAISFTTMRDESVKVYRNLLAHIEAHATLGTNAVHKTLVNEVSELAHHYNQTAYARIRTTTDDTDAPTNEEIPTDVPTDTTLND